MLAVIVRNHHSIDMNITSDWHIHSEHSCDCACMSIADLAAEAEGRGISDLGVTDHIHTPYNLPDIESCRKAFGQACSSSRFHFGVEVSCVSQWEIDKISKGYLEDPVYGIREGGPAGCDLAIGITDADIAHFNIEYVVGGTHWPMYVEIEREAVIRDYHHQNMFLATHELIDIVAHPWWWHKDWQNDDGSFTGKPWFDDFTCIPKSMHNEFAAAAVEHDTKIEISIGPVLLNPGYPDRFKHQYLDYLAELKAVGASLSLGSDCHSKHYDTDFEKAASMLESVGITDDDLWALPSRNEQRGDTDV